MTHLNPGACAPQRPARTPHRTRAASVAALAAALLAALTGVTAVAAGSPPIAVLDSHHTIDFGTAIRFSLDITGNQAPITEVKARFKPRGPNTVWSYTYADLTAGETVHAGFKIATGGSAYYPPGVEFDVYWIVTDAAGNVLETQPERVEYLDPRFEWERRTAGALTAVSHDVAPSTVDALLDAATEGLPAIMEAVGLDSPGEYTAVLFSSTADAEPFFPPVSETARREHTFAGFAYSEYGLFVLGRPRPGMFVHELTHLLLADATASPLARPVPAWLNEGLAVFFETGSADASRNKVQATARRGDLLPLSAMNTIPGRPDDISTFYPQSGSFVGYLIERFGRTAIAGILQRLDSGTPIAAAVEQALGTTLEDVDAAFRDSMGAPSTPTPLASPAPDPTATPAATAPAGQPTPDEPAPDKPAPDGNGTTNTLLYLLIAAAGGLLIGAALGRWRRRRPPPHS